MKFKIGDKVDVNSDALRSWNCGHWRNGEVIEIDKKMQNMPYLVRVENGFDRWCNEKELSKSL